MIETLEARALLSANYYVSPKGSDANAGTDATHPWQHVQHAFDAATPGSTVSVLAGRYSEKLILNVSGNATDGFITFQAVGKVTISGKGVAGNDIIYINNQRYVRIVGFNLCDNLHADDGSGIRLTSADDHIELRNNRIYNITGTSAMGITVYGTDPFNGISNLVIDGNEIFRCQPAPSEAITLNGNVHDFAVTNNYVHDVNGIGIDFIAGEGTCSAPATDAARNGVCAGNRVTKVRAPAPAPARLRSEGATPHDAAGITVDGGHDIVVERNVCWRNQVGIEVGAVHASVTAHDVIVRDNVIYNNMEAGLSIGGSDASQGRVRNCQFTNNTTYRNDTAHGSDGEIRVQWASDNRIENNLLDAARGGVLINYENGARNNAADYNLFYAPDGATRARFTFIGLPVEGVAAWTLDSTGDAHSLFAVPIFARGGLFRLAPTSPGVNAGDPLITVSADETDATGSPRLLSGRIDVGANEVG